MTTAPPRPRTQLTFAGQIRSEWIKPRSLHSTVWSCSILVLSIIVLGTLVAAALPTIGTDLATPGSLEAQAAWLETTTVGIAQLIAAILGVIVATSEFGTGLIQDRLHHSTETYSRDPCEGVGAGSSDLRRHPARAGWDSGSGRSPARTAQA